MFKLEKFRVDFLIVFILFAALVIIYLPALINHFASGDDLIEFWHFQNGQRNVSPHFYNTLSTGRVVAALLYWPLWFFVRNMDALIVMRLINLFLTSVCGLIFVRWLCKNGIYSLHAVYLLLFIFTLPPFNRFGFVACEIFTIFALFCAMIAGITACDGIDKADRKKLFISGAWLFLSMLIYTPIAFFYWVMVLVNARNKPIYFRQFMRHLAIVVVTSLIFLCLAKVCEFGTLRYFHDIPPGVIDDSHRIAFAGDIRYPVMMFFLALVQALSLWKIVFYVKIVAGSTLVAVVGLAIALVSSRHGAKAGFNAQKLFIFLCAMPLSMLMPLLASSPIFAFRTLAGLYAVVVFCLFLSLEKICDFFCGAWSRVVLLGFILAALLISVQHVQINLIRKIIKTSQYELGYARELIQRKYKTEGITQIHLIRPAVKNWQMFYRPVIIGIDEFGLLSSAFVQHANAFVVCAMEQAGISPEDIRRTKITTSNFREHYVFPAGARVLVIDMNVMLYYAYTKGVKL